LGQALARLAIGARLRAARPEPPRDAMRDQSGHRGATGLVGAADLAEEDPEGHQRREDAVLPGGFDLPDRLGEAARREDLREGEPALLQELLSEGGDLPAKTSVRGVSH